MRAIRRGNFLQPGTSSRRGSRCSSRARSRVPSTPPERPWRLSPRRFKKRTDVGDPIRAGWRPFQFEYWGSYVVDFFLLPPTCSFVSIFTSSHLLGSAPQVRDRTDMYVHTMYVCILGVRYNTRLERGSWSTLLVVWYFGNSTTVLFFNAPATMIVVLL